MGHPVQFSGVDLGHALGQAVGDALAHGCFAVGVRRGGDGALGEVHRGVFQNAGGITVLVAHDDAAGDVGRVAIDPGGFQRCAVERQHMEVEPLHGDRGVGRNGVHPAAVRQFPAPKFRVPAAALDPLARLQAARRFANDAGKFLRTFRLAQIGLGEEIGADQEMGVAVDEAGHDEGPGQIDDAGGLAAVRLDRRATQRCYPTACDADGGEGWRPLPGPDRGVDIGGVERLPLRPTAPGQQRQRDTPSAPDQQIATADAHAFVSSSSRSSL